MPKHDFLTPKAISNRIKSKGLQKLRWYCQMCQKQCRDENGFKCHITSESHQRQLLLVAENPGRFIGSFSHEFFRDFMQLLRTSYGTRRILANEVYQQYIKDKDHYHMNATKWETLTGFVMYLGREGHCEVEPTQKGWYIKYIDRSPETLARQAAADKKKKMDKDDEEKIQQAIEEQISRALASKKNDDEETVYTEFHRDDEEKKIVLDFKSGVGLNPLPSSSSSSSASSSSTVSTSETTNEKPDGRDEEELRGSSEATLDNGPSSSRGSDKKEDGFAKPTGRIQAVAAPGTFKNATKKKDKKPKDSESRKRKRSALDEIREMEELKKEKRNRRDNWTTEGIVVKVIHEKLGEKFYRKKGSIEEVRDLYTAIVKMAETGDVIKIDQTYLETVIPAIGKPVLVVNGAYRGLRALLESINVNKYSATVKIDQGPARGRIVEGVAYEDISKLS